jgi:four helix bundle protein
MSQTPQRKSYDLEDRAFEFARRCRCFVKLLPRSLCNHEDAKQLIRSSGSVGADYIEANEAISKKDFAHRLRISRKEAKETRYWLRLVDIEQTAGLEAERASLIQETTELLRILSAIIEKTEK